MTMYDDNDEWAEELLKEYKEFFVNERFTIDCMGGWQKILKDMLEKLRQTNCPISIVQIKEKFGTLRVYGGLKEEQAAMQTLNKSDEIQEIIDAACRKSHTTCERCGKKGKLRNNNGWYETICPECRVYRRFEKAR